MPATRIWKNNTVRRLGVLLSAVYSSSYYYNPASDMLTFPTRETRTRIEIFTPGSWLYHPVSFLAADRSSVDRASPSILSVDLQESHLVSISTPSRFQRLDVPMKRTREVHDASGTRRPTRSLQHSSLSLHAPVCATCGSSLPLAAFWRGFRIISSRLGPPSTNGGVNRQLSSSGLADSVRAEPGTSTGGDH